MVAFLALMPSSCGARTQLAEGHGSTSSNAESDGGAGGAGGLGAGGAGFAGADAGAPPQCLCPDEPGYAPCQLPLMCCPCAPSCEDPATFNCTCSDPHACTGP